MTADVENASAVDGNETDANKNAGKVTHKTPKKSTGKGGVGTPESERIKPSYGGDPDANDKTKPTGKSTVEGKKELEYKKEDNDTSKIQVITDEKTEKEDPNKDKPQVISDDEMKNSKDNTTDKPQEPKNTYEGPKTADENFLDKYGNDNNKEDTKDNTQSNDNKEDKKDDNKDEQKDTTPLVPVSIKAEAESAIAGDSVRFDISGDVESISGFEGITVESIKNGAIVINTPAGKTQTITISVVGKDGSKAEAKILVRSIEDQIKLIKDENNNTTEDTNKDNTNKDDNKNDETKPVSYKPVSMRVDKKEFFVGDTIQFFISGDVESVNGAGKSLSDVKDGTLQFAAEKVGKVTISVVGKDGSKASETIEVKDFPWNVKQEETTVENNEKVEQESNPQVTVPTNNSAEDSKKAAEDEAAKKAAEEAAAKKAAEEAAAKKAAEEAAAKKAAEEAAAKKAAEEAAAKKAAEEAKKEQEKPKYTPVSITSQNGSTANAGDQVKFSIHGDVASISGTDGFATSNANGVLTVYTDPGVTTVITIVVKGMDGSTSSASVTVNCPVPDNA